MKKVFSLLVSLLLCFSMPVSVNTYADSFAAVQPYYDKAVNVSSELFINGTTATCESKVTGYSDVVKITATQYLQRQGFLWIWTTYDDAEWTKTVYSNTLVISNTKTGLTSGNYRLKTDFMLTDKYGKAEIIKVYSDEKSV